MTKIKIKCKPNTKDNKLKLIETLSKKDIEISRIITTNNGFAVLTINEHHADSIFHNDTKTELDAHGFTAYMPPELKVKKCVIIPRVDDIIYEKHIVDIGEELQKQNTWIGEDLIDVYKFPRSPTVKLTFSQTLTAQKCTEKGLKAFNISIPSYEIKHETYIPIKCCMRCYALEEHYITECPLPKEYKICSRCSNVGHVWHQCQDLSEKCINCGGDHNALAMI